MSKVHSLKQSLHEAISYTLGEEQRTGLHPTLSSRNLQELLEKNEKKRGEFNWKLLVHWKPNDKKLLNLSASSDLRSGKH